MAVSPICHHNGQAGWKVLLFPILSTVFGQFGLHSFSPSLNYYDFVLFQERQELRREMLQMAQAASKDLPKEEESRESF